MQELTYGQVVISKAGRDKGKYFIIMDINDTFVELVDGVSRRLDHPKLKKKRHIQPTNNVIDEIRYKIRNQLKVTNLEIRQALEEFK